MLFDGSLYRLFSENCTCSNLLNYWYSVTLVWQLDIKFARLAPTFPIKLRSFLPKYLVGTFFSILRKKTTKSTFDYRINEVRKTQNAILPAQIQPEIWIQILVILLQLYHCNGNLLKIYPSWTRVSGGPSECMCKKIDFQLAAVTSSEERDFKGYG